MIIIMKKKNKRNSILKANIYEKPKIKQLLENKINLDKEKKA